MAERRSKNVSKAQAITWYSTPTVVCMFDLRPDHKKRNQIVIPQLWHLLLLGKASLLLDRLLHILHARGVLHVVLLAAKRYLHAHGIGALHVK